MSTGVATFGNSRSEDVSAVFQVVLRFLLTISLAMAVVVPHSFQIVEAVFFGITSFVALLFLRNDRWLQIIIATYLLGIIVTCIYVWVGYVNLAPRAASNQTLFVYTVSPLMWIVMSASLFQTIGKEGVVKLLISLSWWAGLSVGLFFFAYLNFGKASVSFLTEEANVNVSGGFAAATMLVYGSLIFVVGAIFAEPGLIKNKAARIILPVILIICALTSGRSAVILAVPVGAAVGLFLRSRLRVRVPGAPRRRSPLVALLILGLVVVAVALVLDAFLDTLDLTLVLGQFYDELTSGGGDVRTEQTAALLNGFLDNYGIGSGHGIGVSYVRSLVFPWRYEVVPAATLFRVGLIGSLIYALPFVIYGQAFLARLARRDLVQEDIYMFGGFVSVAIAVFTNPYVESFVFQWMYVLPVMSFCAPLVRSSAGAGSSD